MTKIIAKNVEHRYSPRVPNRTEPREFDRYSIHIANNHCKVDLWSVYKKGEEILHTILGDIEFAFPEALKFIPDSRVKDFTNDFSRMSIELNILSIPFEQFSDLAIILAVVVFPTPLIPVNK